MSENILSIQDLNVDFQTEAGVVHAIRGVSFDLKPQEVIGIVGESGSGKSVTSLASIGLLARSATTTGTILIDNQSVTTMSEKELSNLRGTTVAMIFQDPMTSLNPVYTIGWQIVEALRAHQKISKKEARVEAQRLLELVGIPQAEKRLDNYPHEFSGGMRQRAVIAIAMANQPKVILADEPTTALDVTVQAQVLQTLRTALEISKAALVLITHDLGVIAGFADRILVMYAGRVVESGLVDEIFYRPAMPYTHGLLGSIPSIDSVSSVRLRQIPGSPPTMVGTHTGCPFAARCPLRKEICLTEEPELKLVAASTNSSIGSEHRSACHFADEVVEMPVASMFPDSSEDFSEESK